MAQIIVSANIVIPNGPSLVFNQKLEVEAYDLIEVTVTSGGTPDMEVELPGSTDGVQFITIKSNWFGEHLTYKINDSTGTKRMLDQPHLLFGKGAISLFADAVAPGAPPAKLFFTNVVSDPDTGDAKVQILIGRDATPTPP
jgi:hypothetical protein